MRHALEPNDTNGFYPEHINLLLYSFKTLTGRDLVSSEMEPLAAAKAIYFAPFAVVSHDTSADPIFNYANQTALLLFEMSWEEFTTLPSRCSADTPNQEERTRQLDEVTRKGFIENYSGIRISKKGNRFVIENAVVWNLIDPSGNYRGQAATFNEWRSI
ncbi:MAG: MEKHLA domain-containing protein [Pseudomonadota bacterium]